MKILEVTFDCTIAMPGYSNVKPGIARAIIDEANGETPEQAWTELNKRAQEWHKREYPSLYPSLPPSPDLMTRALGDGQIPIISKEKERLEIAIDNATELDELRSIKDQCWNADLSVPWVIKLNELNNGRLSSSTEGLGAC